MEQIESISLIVKDKAKALEFYTEKVGFEKKIDVTNYGHRWVTVGPKGQALQLELWQVGSPDPTGWSKNWKPGNAPPIVLLVDDCYKMFAELKAKGVEFRRDLEEYPQGVSATFSDPDGNLFTIRGLPQKDSWHRG
jgi:catechol 2,3-dioxygenase-like lactoylglutathione lyase family enzyme